MNDWFWSGEVWFSCCESYDVDALFFEGGGKVCEGHGFRRFEGSDSRVEGGVDDGLGGGGGGGGGGGMVVRKERGGGVRVIDGVWWCKCFVLCAVDLPMVMIFDGMMGFDFEDLER